MMKKSIWAGLFCAALAVHAEVVNTVELYALPAGETDTLTTAATYDAMRIAGELTVNGVAIACTNIVTTGGLVRVTGKNASLGNAAQTIWNVSSNAVDGAVTHLGAAASGQLGVKELRLNLDDGELAARPDFDGTFDFLSISNAIVTLKRCWNYSSATGRIVVTGTSSMKRPTGYDAAGTFQKGAFRFQLRNNAAFTFDTANQKGTLAETAASVRFEGLGNVKVISGTELNSSYKFPLYAGSVFDNLGSVTFEPAYTPTRITFKYGQAFGPNVTSLKTAASGYRVELFVSPLVELALPPETVLYETAVFSGTGGLLLDATRRSVAFTGSVLADPACSVTVRKIGTYEATISSTNLVGLVVDAGDVRLVHDCVVRTVSTAAGARVVVDGCKMKLGTDSFLKTANVVCINGGEIVKEGVDSTSVYGASSLDGPLHVKEGTLLFSQSGIDARHWRFVLKKNKKDATTKEWFAINRIWLFGNDGSHVGTDLSYQAQDVGETTELPEGKVRFVASETLVHSTSDSWNDLGTLPNLFTRPNEKVNLNNHPWLMGLTQDIDPENPDTWVTIEWKLKAATAKPIVSYNIAYSYNGRYPTVWSLEYYDEEAGAWVVADARTNPRIVLPPNAWDGYYYYDGVYIPDLIDCSPAEFFQISGYRREGLATPSLPLAVQVDTDAELDLRAFTEAPVIKALTIDAAGGGTIHGGRLAEAGSLVIAGSSASLGTESVAIDLDDVADVVRLANWPVTLFGAEVPGLSLVYDAENKRIVLPSLRTLTVTKSGEVDILEGLLENQGVCVNVASGISCTNVSALTGSHLIYKTGAGTLSLTASSPDFTSPICVYAGSLAGRVDNAFGTGTVTVMGSTTSTCRVMLGSATANTAYDNDFVFEGDSSETYPACYIITSGLKTTTVNGSITAHGFLGMTDSGVGDGQGKELVFFNGPINAQRYTVSYPADNYVQWKGTVRAATLRAAAGYPRMGRFDLWSSTNEIGVLDLNYVSCVARAAQVFGGAKLYYAGGNNEGGRGFFNLNGFSQIASSIDNESMTLKVKEVRNGSAAATLTLTGGMARAVSTSRLLAGSSKGKRLSLVVDAGNEDFVQIFSNSVSTTAGDFTVRNGTLCFAGTASATNVPSVSVEGGTFDVATSAAGAFSGVTNLTVGSAATLRMGTAVSTPFGTALGEGASRAVLSIAEDSVLDLAAGTETVVYSLSVGGRMKASGVYVGEGGTGGRVLPQITGTGVLRVRTGNGGTLMIFR